MITRKTGKLWLELITDRKKVTIESVVKPMLKQGWCGKIKICTDALKSYNFLDSRYKHLIIDKKNEGFAVGEKTWTGEIYNVNVNKIEGTWSHLRKLLRTRNAYAQKEFLHLTIAEFMYNYYKLDWFDLIRV